MLVLYTADMNFPGGQSAANYTVAVRPLGSNQLARLFSDAAGENRADNPLTTDEFGTGTFYAAPGDYVSVIAGERFDYRVDPSFTDPVWSGLWVHNQSTPSNPWLVAHRFGVFPHVTVTVSNGVIQADVTHPDDENTSIAFGSPVTGIAYLRR